MNTKKRGLAWLLTLAMCMSMMTLSAFASSSYAITDENGWNTMVGEFGTIPETNITITVTGTFSTGNQLIIPDGKTVTLNLNGAVSYNQANRTDGSNYFAIENRGNLTISGNGSITSTSTTNYDGVVYNAGTLTINGGTFTASTSAAGIAVYNNGISATLNGGNYSGWCAAYNNRGNMTISGTAYTGSGISGSVRSYAVRQMSDGMLTITGGTVTGGHGAVAVSNGSVNISGGTFTAESSGYCALYMAGERGTVTGTVSGGNFISNSRYPAIWVGNGGSYGGSHQRATLTISSANLSAINALAVIDAVDATAITLNTGANSQNGEYGTISITGNSGNVTPGGVTPSGGYSSDDSSDDDSSSGGLTINEDAVPLAENGTTVISLETVTNPDGSVTTTRKYSDGATQVTNEKTVANADGSTTTTSTEKYTAADGIVTDGRSVTNTKTDPTTGTTTSKTNASATSSDGYKSETKSETVSKSDGSSTTTSNEVSTNPAGQKQTTDTETVFDANRSYTQKQDITDYVGSTGSTVTKDGATTSATATISEAAVTQAKANDGVITVPIYIWALEETIAPPMDVNMPLVVTTDSPAKVQVPVVNMGPYAVAYIVDENGNEVLDKYSTMTDTTLIFNVEGTSIIKVVDNSKEFVDVPADSWMNDAIQYVAAREIFKGTSTSEKTYSPDMSTTRGQIATALYRFDRNPLADPNSLLPDAEGKWYETEASWSLNAGVFKGSDGFFEGDRPITRQELAAVLYRYAGANGYKTDGAAALDRFPDANGVAGYAKEAMEWAVGNGIITGSNGKLIAGETATRAQVSAMFMRFCQNIVK